jgi:hypothetical protein
MASQPMNANQQQLAYNQAEAAQEKSRLLTGFGSLNSEQQIAHARNKARIEETREARRVAFAESERQRFNAPNPFQPQESSLGPMIPKNTTRAKGDATGMVGDNMIADSGNIFNTGSSIAASNMFGNEATGSFDRTMPPAIQELTPDETGMNSLYNKTI